MHNNTEIMGKENLNLDTLIIDLGAPKTEDILGGLIEPVNKSEEEKPIEGSETPAEGAETLPKDVEKEFSLDEFLDKTLGDTPIEEVKDKDDNNPGKDNSEKDSNPTKPGESPNVFSSLAKACKETVLSNLEETEFDNIKSEEDLINAIEKEVTTRLSEDQRRIKEALDYQVEPDVISTHENTIKYLDSITEETLKDDSEDGINLRTQLLMANYINKGFSREKAARAVKNSIDAGNDIEDAIEALEDNKAYYKDNYNKIIETAKKESLEVEKAMKKRIETISKEVLEKDTIFEGLTLTKPVRQEILKNLQHPVFTDTEGNNYSAIQKFEKEHPEEFMVKLGVLFTLTDGFTKLDKITNTISSKVKKDTISELERVLTSDSNTITGGAPQFANSLGKDEDSSDMGSFNLDAVLGRK